MDDELRRLLAAANPRYAGFTLLDAPVPFNELFAGQPFATVQVHSAATYRVGADEGVVGFCGAFAWDGRELTPLDGDSYAAAMPVVGHDLFVNADGVECLDVLVTDW